LGVRKLPSYIPPTVNRQPSIQEERTVFACTADGDHDSGQDHYETPGDSTQTEATKQSGTPISLIQNWVGRDANGRSQQPAPRHKSNGISKDKQKLSRALGLKNGEAPSSYESEDTQLVAEFDETDPTQAQDISRPVQDFNARMASQQAKATQQQPPPLSPSTDSGTIPVITATPRKPTPGPVQNAFDRMRPQRTPVETATITVGDNTTFTRIGTSATKRRKCQTLKDSSSTSKFGASPLFGKSLRAFAAPGTQAGSGEDGEEEGDEDTSQQEPELELANSALESEPEGSEATSDPEDASQDQKVDASPALPGAMPEENPSLLLSDGGGSDDEYIDEGEKKAREEAKVAQMIRSAEEVAARPTQANLKRATTVLKGRAGHRSSTLELVRFLETSAARVDQQLARLTDALQPYALKEANKDTVVGDDIADEAAEERLSLTVAKPDFARMRVVGQFNLGFILATRSSPTTESTAASDELFIIDQHASDEKYNFERLQRETVVQNQRLVGPKVLDLTAIEEEIIDAHSEALAKNGFVVEIDTSGDSHVGQRCRLLTLPMSKEVVFDTRDLEELLALLSERAGSGIPRPSKVRRMFAMRACRSSIMVGKALTTKRMESVVRHMGEIDKPWNCPHGRPTMRHLAGLDAWEGWSEGDQAADDEYGLASRKTDWEGYMRGKTKSVAPSEVGETGEDALEEDG
ncbi:ATP-binding mismatch repair protein, partial [Cryomyces antarcticus]